MSGIVCAIRGGLESRPTIDRAIVLAQESGLPIYFLYVVNLDFLSRTTSSRIHTISHEMRQMGEFILISARSAAEAQGVEAFGIVRDGNVLEEVTRLCRELQADYLILGVPRTHNEENVFTHELVSHFAREIHALTGAEVVIPEGDLP